MYENFQGNFFRVKNFRGSMVHTKLFLHEFTVKEPSVFSTTMHNHYL